MCSIVGVKSGVDMRKSVLPQQLWHVLDPFLIVALFRIMMHLAVSQHIIIGFYKAMQSHIWMFAFRKMLYKVAAHS